MTTPKQHAEVCIAILNHIAKADGWGMWKREDIGLEPVTDSCLLCELYEDDDGECIKSICPGRNLCREYSNTPVTFPREQWVRAYRYHAGRAK